jgi:cellulose synthase/poly-beta-1,6-N-acetylglucosamine synthase-like glycosyltransferase
MLIGWLRIPLQKPIDAFKPTHKISVIIPVRNEELYIENLLKDIMEQKYPSNLLEVIVVNDQSTDRTMEILQNLDLNINIFVHESPFNGKKEALEHGITLSTGEVIVTTDADCRVGPEWLEQISWSIQKYNALMISGPVRFRNTGTFWNQGLMMEFAALQGTGAASLNFNFPTMCNGANLAYLKTAFQNVKGFEGNKDIPSGDDEFLMHRISRKYPGRIHYLKSRAAIVETEPCSSITAWYNQRLRWASKWRRYEINSPRGIALVIFLVNLNLIFGLILWQLGVIAATVFFTIFGIKTFVDFIFVYVVNRFLKMRSNILIQILVEMFYPLYVLFFGILGIFGNYTWKGRNSKFGK